MADELQKSDFNRSLLSMPDMVILDMREPVHMPAGSGKPIVALTPENLYLASKMLPIMSIYIIEDIMEVCDDPEGACLSRISPCLTWRERWEVAVFKLAPEGATIEHVRQDMQNALAGAVAPSLGVDGVEPKRLSKISWTGRLNFLELSVLLRACPLMMNNLDLVGSMVVELKFVEQDGETYSSKLLAEFIGGWLFSAAGSDSITAGKRRLHEPPGTHGYAALVPMTGRKPFERMRIDLETGRYVMHAAVAHYTAAGSYAGGGAFTYPRNMRAPPPGHQWTYSLIDEKYVPIPRVGDAELPRAPQDTPLALQEKVAKSSRPLLSRFLFGFGRDGSESRLKRLRDSPCSGPGVGVVRDSSSGKKPAAPAPPEEPPSDPTVGANAAIGDRFKARDSWGKWIVARVEAVCDEGLERELLVHFLGWNAMWDEWVRVGTGRLKALA